MEFRTKIPIKTQEPAIGYDSQVLLLGSCFVENIGKRLEYHKFRTLQNPFGILFHPAAISNFLEKVRSRYVFSENDIFFHNERWHSFDAHSALSNPDKDKMLQDLNAAVEETYSFLKSVSHIIITPGTAWGYKFLETGKTVANCHKLPQKKFFKELTEVESGLKSCVEVIKTINPKATVIFTVSPVRHLRDGFMENQQSKARLITAIHELLKIPAPGIRRSYFPSYEIMMDELRDYRFYAEDMIHPNSVAVDYIWQRFVETWMSPETQKTSEEVEKIQKGLAHKPFNEDSEAHQQFRSKLQQKIQELQVKFPYIEF
ncbi:hypothetical protein GCM10007103_03960 [Salinimicrobium marinum]|uniref:GSCFA domain-containing protein n=1 Tax=Salinimicrobium marinum TaxID=680283 RepID=A0A918S8A0_9FLAO|nr:GSCFA domain-containing protein [Salinimicrobium marinum]GHA25912.1 hypothetical protein GCM10007103_03960 [Salinimicrobium marinum]